MADNIVLTDINEERKTSPKGVINVCLGRDYVEKVCGSRVIKSQLLLVRAEYKEPKM